MSGDPYYALEKLTTAAEVLRSKRGGYRSRLEAAFMSFHPAKPRDFPDHLAAEYEAICEQLTRVPATGDEGDLRATLAAMSESEARDLSERLLGLYGALRAHLR